MLSYLSWVFNLASRRAQILQIPNLYSFAFAPFNDNSQLVFCTTGAQLVLFLFLNFIVIIICLLCGIKIKTEIKEPNASDDPYQCTDRKQSTVIT